MSIISDYFFMIILQCLNTYVYPTVDPGYSEGDPRWLGAWSVCISQKKDEDRREGKTSSLLVGGCIGMPH